LGTVEKFGYVRSRRRRRGEKEGAKRRCGDAFDMTIYVFTRDQEG
jgi:hypothetical protein